MKKVVWESGRIEDREKPGWHPYILGEKPNDRVFRNGEKWLIIGQFRDSIIASGRIVDVKTVRRVKWIIKPTDWGEIGVSVEQLNAFEAAILEIDATNECTPKEGEVEVSGLYLLSPPVREFIVYQRGICIGRAIVVEEEQ